MTSCKKLWFSVLFFLSLLSCAAQKRNEKPYYESLYEVRPRVVAPADSVAAKAEIVVTENTRVSFKKTVNTKVDLVLDSIDRFNLTRRSVDGYTIQIYSGQNREDAMNTKKKVSSDLPALTANLQYQQPKFRVTIGRYYSKLEAYQDLSAIRALFPAAILVPEKIAIR